MPNLITKPGLYRENGGGRCKITCIDPVNGIALGQDSVDDWNAYRCDDGGCHGQPHDDGHFDLDGPWIEEPKRCPKCNSPHPEMHPIVNDSMEGSTCSHEFHKATPFPHGCGAPEQIDTPSEWKPTG